VIVEVPHKSAPYLGIGGIASSLSADRHAFFNLAGQRRSPDKT
jgi:hypothetical protein